MTTLPISCPPVAPRGRSLSPPTGPQRAARNGQDEGASGSCRERRKQQAWDADAGAEREEGGRDSGQPARRRRVCLVMSRRQRQRQRGGTGLLSNLLAVAVAVTAAWGAGPGTFPLSPLISSLSHLVSLGCLMAPLVGVGAWWWDGHAKTRKNGRRRTRKAARRRLPSSVAARQPVGWGIRPWVQPVAATTSWDW